LRLLKGISVIICTYNGKKHIVNCINHIINQKIHSEYLFELIIVDNASTDGTGDLASNYLSSLTNTLFAWYVIQEERSGLNKARLAGLKKAQYEYILFCDDDNFLNQDYLQIGYDILYNNSNIGVLGGNGKPLFEVDPPEWFDKYAHSFALGPQSNHNGKIAQYPAEVYGAGAFFKKEPLLKFFNSGFSSIMSDRTKNNLSSGGDVEWCYIVQLYGYDVWYDERLQFLHAISSQRLSWNYYISLKKGIASGSGSLLPYHLYFKYGVKSSLFFLYKWFKCCIHAVFVSGKLHLLNFLNKDKKQSDLYRTIWDAKRLSYMSSFKSSFSFYKKLKTL
jgi:glycosyltransferase involved in cell wall biosynthesis